MELTVFVMYLLHYKSMKSATLVPLYPTLIIGPVIKEFLVAVFLHLSGVLIIKIVHVIHQLHLLMQQAKEYVFFVQILYLQLAN